MARVATAENFAEIHARDAARGAARVVIAFGIDHQTVQDGEHFLFDFVLQLRQLAGLDVRRNAVVGMKPLRRRLADERGSFPILVGSSNHGRQGYCVD